MVNPVAGKSIVLSSTLGSISQPQSNTNAQGQTTAVISSTQTGYATLTARNTTDNEDLAVIGSVIFLDSQGSGLVDPRGAPYNSPELSILRPAFYPRCAYDLPFADVEYQG